MEKLGIVEHLDVVHDGVSGLLGWHDLSMEKFLFDLVVEAFYDAVVVAVSLSRHALNEALGLQCTAIAMRRILGEFNRSPTHLVTSLGTSYVRRRLRRGTPMMPADIEVIVGFDRLAGLVAEVMQGRLVEEIFSHVRAELNILDGPGSIFSKGAGQWSRSGSLFFLVMRIESIVNGFSFDEGIAAALATQLSDKTRPTMSCGRVLWRPSKSLSCSIGGLL